METFEDLIAGLSANPSRADITDVIQETMRAQGSVIAGHQLARLRLDEGAIRRRIKSKFLYEVPVGRRIYAGQPGPVAPDGRRWAGLLWAPRASWLTGDSATVVLGLERSQERRVQLLTHESSPLRRRSPEVQLLRSDTVPERDVTAIEGVRCTSVARSLMHVAAGATDKRLDELLGQAMKLRIYDHASLQVILGEHRRFPGRPKLKAALSRIDDQTAYVKSWLEQKAAELINACVDLPNCVVNTMLEGCEMDIHFPGTRAVIECDSGLAHQTPAELARDAEKERILRAAGYFILRLDYATIVHHPHLALQRIIAFYRNNAVPPDPRQTARR